MKKFQKTINEMEERIKNANILWGKLELLNEIQAKHLDVHGNIHIMSKDWQKLAKPYMDAVV